MPGRTEPCFGPLERSFLTQTLDRTLDSVVLVDEAGRVRYWNPASEAAFGYTADEALGAFVHDLIVPVQYRPHHIAGLEIAARTGEGSVLDHRVEVPGLHKDGREISLEVTISALPHGDTYWFSCIMRDLSARKASEEALRRSEERFRHIVETVPGMVYEFATFPDGTYRFEHVSPGCREVFGYDAETFLRTFAGLSELVVEEDRAGYFASAEIAVKGLQTWNWEGRVRVLGGAIRSIRCESRPAHRPDGAIVWYGVITDVTEMSLAQSALADANHELEERVRRRTEELHATQSEILARLGRAAAFRDDDTGQHIERMSRTCALIARELGLGEAECDVILHAAPMHDIGKIAIPDSILHKPGRLDPEEMTTMRTHAEIGAEMLSGADSELVRMAELIALTHHERWDGTGYPHRLKEQEIPLVGRIAAVADVFDALTSERPYKRAWSVEAAVAEIERSAGSHFDPAVVRAFVRTVPWLLQQEAATDAIPIAA